MKQTNNALKFLLAQYRAIFKNAYVKGLASAAIVTAGLALAGTAQAAVPASYDGYKGIGAGDGQINWNTNAANPPTEVPEEVTDKVFIDSNAYINNATITGNGAIATDTSAGKTLFVSGSLTFKDGAELNLSGTSANNGWAILGYDGTAIDNNSKNENGTLRLINNAEANISGAAVQIGNILVDGANVTVGGSITQKTTNRTWDANAQLGAAASGAGNNGNLTITNDSVVNINSGGSVYGRTVSIDNSAVNFNGTTDTTKTGSAIIYAFVDAVTPDDATTEIDGNISFNNATVTVAKGSMGGIFGSAGKTVASSPTAASPVNRVNIDVTNSTVTIEDGGTLQMGLLAKQDGTSYVATTASQTIKNGTTITAAPIINLNSGAAISNAGTIEFVATGKDLTDAANTNANETVEINLNNGATITNAEGAAIVLGKGNQLNFNGGDIDNTNGTFTIKQGAIAKVTETNVVDTAGNVISDGVTNLAGTLVIDGRLEVQPDTTLSIADGAVLTTATGTSGATTTNGNGVIVLSGSTASDLNKQARLNVSEDTLAGFLKSGDIVANKTDKAGAVVLNEAVVDFGESINLNNLKFANAESGSTDFSGGYISTLGQSTITANTITLTDVLETVDLGSPDQNIKDNLTLETDNFKINALATAANNINKANGTLGFKEAVVHSNLDVQYVGNTNLLVGDTYYLDAYSEDATNSNAYVAGNGTITGDNFTLANGGSLNFRAGNWTAQQAITLDADTTANSGGSINVTTSIGSSEIFTDNQMTGASDEILLSSTNVKLNGLVFNVGEAGTVNGKPSVTVSNSDAAYDAGLTATLDLTSGISVVNVSATPANNGTGEIKVDGKGATVLLDGSDVNAIFGSGSMQYVGLGAFNGGTLQANSAVSGAYDDFKSGAAATVTSGDVTFYDGGVFKAPSLTLTGTASTEGTTTTVNIGAGNTIVVDALVLNENKANAVTGDTKTILQSGNLEVAQSFTAQSDILNVSGASVNLDTGDAATTGSLAIKDLLITAGFFNVDQGTWNSYTSDVNVNGGTLSVGDDAYSEGATFAANLLTVGEEQSSKVNVADLGTASFVAADLSAANTGAITVSGKMTIEGAELDMNGDKTTGENHHGLYFGKSNKTTGIFDVDGGTLTFGAEATKTFYNADAKVQESGAAVNDESGNLAYRLPYVEESSQDKLSVQNGGTVALTFADGTSFNGAQILSLKEQLFAEIADGAGATKLDGFLNIGDATISGINVVNGAISWSELEPYTDIVWDTTNTELGTAKVTGVTQTSQIGGSYGSLEAVNGTDHVTIASNTELSNAAGNQGNFIGTADGTTIGAHVAADQILLLNGTGNVGAINLANSNDPNDATEVVFNATASGDAITVTGNVTGALTSNTSVTASGAGTTTVQGNVAANDVGADLGSTFVITGDLNAEDLWATGGTLEVQRDVTTKNLNALQGSTLSVAGDLTLSANGTGTTVLEDNSSLSVAGDLTVAATHGAGTLIRVGSDDISHTEYDNAQQPDGSNPYDRYVNSAEDNTSGLISNTASTGYMEVLGEVNLNGATLYVDPSYDMNTSMVSLAKFADNNLNRGQLGTLDGNIVVGKNAAVGLGVTNAQLADIIARYQSNGSLREGEYGSVLYVAGQLNVADGQTIALNSNARNTTLANIEADFGTSAEAQAADLSLGSNTALIISDNAVQAAAASTESAHDAAIEFNKAGASIYAQADAAVLLDGTTFSLNGIKLFDDAEGNGVTLTTADKAGLYVGTVSGLFETWLADGTVGTVQLGITRHGLDDTALSNPVRDSIYNLLGATVLIEEPVTPPTTEEQPSTDGEDDTTTPPADGEQENINQEQKVATASVTPIAAPTTGTYENRYLVEQGSFIATALAEQRSLQSVEQAARLGAYAGTMQATLGASNTTTDAIAGRMGMGAQAGTITYADNAQGAALWVTPVYKSHSSDGFDAEGADYGVDLDLYGLALGADYTLGNGLRVGALFNVGSGSADGNGVASGVSNDFDYYSFGVYGGYTMGAISVLADLSYTSVDNDFDATTGLTTYDKLEGSADSDALSLGVTAQYAFDTGSVTVTPHAGLRFTRLSLDDYGVQSGGVEVAGMSSDNLNVFSIPVGVTFASEFNAGAWSVQPALDLTLTGNFGDTDLDADSCWSGTDNGYDDLSYGVSTEFLDDFTYGATLGIAAKTGNFSLGLGVNYTGSSNTDEYGVTANARFVF